MVYRIYLTSKREAVKIKIKMSTIVLVNGVSIYKTLQKACINIYHFI